MTRNDIDAIITILCPDDEDFEKPIISPAYLKKELESLALEQEPYDWLKLDGMLEDAYEHGYQQARYDYEVQTCEDAVSRKDIEECKELMTDVNGETVYAARMSDIRKLLPVVSGPKTGTWVKMDTNMYSCSNCSYCFSIVPEDNNISQFKQCPYCGVKM